MERTEFACIHEAGHAIVVRVLGGILLGINVDGFSGHVTYAGIDNWQDEVLIAMAGELAAAEVVGPKFGKVGASSDRGKVAYRFRKHGAGKALRTALRGRAAELVHEHMPVIMALARELLAADGDGNETTFL